MGVGVGNGLGGVLEEGGAEGLGSERVGLDLKKAGNGGSSVGRLVGFSEGGGWPASIQKRPSM